MKSGEGEPRLVPKKYQIGLDCQALLHDSIDIVDDAIEGAVGQRQHLHSIEQTGTAIVQ
jgi:hypothetical protein